MKRRVLLHRAEPATIRSLEGIPGWRARVELAESRSDRPLRDQILADRPDLLLLDADRLGHEAKRATAEARSAVTLPILVMADYVCGGPEVVIEALGEGATDFAESPAGAQADPLRLRRESDVLERIERAFRGRAPARTATLRRPAPAPADPPLVIIGVSTGGPSTLQALLSGLPGDLPATIIVVQHMPAGFTPALAESLDRTAPMTVREATAGDVPVPGRVILVPGGCHVEFAPRGRLHLFAPNPRARFVPSIDLAMISAARSCGEGVIGLLLTGMGRDGILGLRAVRRAGGRTLAQDEASSVMAAMPKAAADLGVADQVVPLDALARELERGIRRTDRHLRQARRTQ